MTKIYLAEKPSQAMDIGRVIGVKSRGDGFLLLNDGSCITWAVGHMLELVEPDVYHDSWGGRWDWAQLPMIPKTWSYAVSKRTAKQFAVVKKLLKTATSVVIATDAGREGELIAREILEYVKYKGPVSRFWTSSLVPADIKRALDNLRPGSETYPLYEAALARSHCDWMLGLSVTRAATLAAKARGDYFAVGRVKTPTLALVVRRDKLVAGFSTVPYFEIEANVRSARGIEFKMTHSPVEAERITVKSVAEGLMAKANGARGPLKVSKKNESEHPPLPYSLPALQKDANKILGFSAKNTLKVAQSLYEKKAVTYPRTDCSYLAVSQIDEIGPTLEAISERFSQLVKLVEDNGVTTRNTTFNDAKLTDHHGIVPTKVFVPDLNEEELGLYSLIAQRYLLTLSPSHLYVSTEVLMDAGGVPFKATGNVTTVKGWRALLGTAADNNGE